VCDVAIECDDGTVRDGRCVAAGGESTRPHSEEEPKDKLFDLGAPIRDEETAAARCAGLWRLDQIPDFRKFTDALRLQPARRDVPTTPDRHAALRAREGHWILPSSTSGVGTRGA